MVLIIDVKKENSNEVAKIAAWIILIFVNTVFGFLTFSMISNDFFL